MRILLLADNYYPSRAACAVRMKIFAETLIACGHDVQVLASETSLEASYPGYVKPPYVAFFQVIPLQEKTVINRLKNNLSGAKGAERAAKAMGTFDVVLVTSPPLLLTGAAIKIAKRAKARLVLDVRDIWPDVAYEMGSFSPASVYGRVFAYVANKAYRRASLITTPTPGKVAKIQAKGMAPEGKVRLVENGLDVDFVNQEEDLSIVEKYDLEKGPVCSYVGNIGLAQGLASVFELAQHRTDVRFLLFGKGAEAKGLEKKAIELGLDNVCFCGVIDAQGVYTVLKHSDVSFVPLVNSRLTDSVPTKMFEAIGCGCPVLLAAAGDAAAVLEEMGLGRSAAPEDLAGLMEAFDAMLDGPFSDEEKAAAADLVKKDYSRQAAALKLESYVREVVGDI